MKVLLATLNPENGGQLRTLVHLAAGLEQEGAQVSIRSLFDCDPRDERFFAQGRTCRRTPVGVARLLSRIASDAADVDVVQLHLPNAGFSAIADGLKLGLRQKLVVYFESQLVDEWSRTARHTLHDPKFFAPRLLLSNPVLALASARRADAYVVSSAYQRSQLERFGWRGKEVHVIPNAAFPGEPSRADKLTARGKLGLSGAAPLIGFAGNFNPVKGLDLLLEAMRGVVAHRPDVHLAIAWSGVGEQKNRRHARLHEQLARLGLAERTTVLGRVEVPHFLAALDVLAAPFVAGYGSQVFPNIVLEAIALGIPTVTSRVAAMEELAGDRVLLAPPRAPPLAEALERALRLERSAQVPYPETPFHHRRVAARYLEIYGR